MKERNPLWDELEAQKVLLEAQKGRVYQQLKELVDTVLAGQITDWPEVENLLFELLEFGDYYRPAWELYIQLKQYIGKHFSSDVQREDSFVKFLIKDTVKGEETL